MKKLNARGLAKFVNRTTIGWVALSTALIAAVTISVYQYQEKLAGNINYTRPVLPEAEPKQEKFGLVTSRYCENHDVIAQNETLGGLLARYNTPASIINQLGEACDGIFEFRNFRAGKPYWVFKDPETDLPAYLIYESSIYTYYKFSLEEQLRVEQVDRPVTYRQASAEGIIKSSLWEAMTSSGLSFELADKMEDVFAWSVDFHHLQRNDAFKLFYTEKMVDGKVAGVGEIQAAYFKDARNEHYGFRYANDKYDGYYDLEGRPLKKAFLKAPVKFSRVSSRYNLRRFHPILKRVRPHYGTDYAAPYGTPILAVGNGVVVKAGYTRGNGNFVKIKHDDVYQTQYLHMQRFAKGIRSGVQVKQGEVIGYVGSTGLATGPHVCFRFWKYGKQVDHTKENLPPPEPMDPSELPAYFEIRDSLKAIIDAMPMPTIVEEESVFSSDSTGVANP